MTTLRPETRAMTTLRHGFTTGACAAAAAKAATMLLAREPSPSEVEIGLPDGTRIRLPIHRAQALADEAEAAVRKDAGDDPDVTHGCEIIARVRWSQTEDVGLSAGEGVGTVTKPGLAIAPGEPAINPVPRRMILAAVREVTSHGLDITLSIPGGAEIAAKTFNPRLGIVGGLSILGTTGNVRPFSTPALRQALLCSITVAKACGVRAPVLVPGHIGERAARAHFGLSAEQVIEVGNEWGFLLDEVGAASFERVLLVGHAGKLAKLAEGEWDTHSARSRSAVPAVACIAREALDLRAIDGSLAVTQGPAVTQRPAAVTQGPSAVTREPAATFSTVEGLLSSLAPAARTIVANAVAARVADAVENRIRRPAAVVLVSLQGVQVGHAGDLTPWGSCGSSSPCR